LHLFRVLLNRLSIAARDVRVPVLEARETTSADPKAISIDESLRTYAVAGIIAAILPILSSHSPRASHAPWRPRHDHGNFACV
jgi:hypothetical protein